MFQFDTQNRFSTYLNKKAIRRRNFFENLEKILFFRNFVLFFSAFFVGSLLLFASSWAFCQSSESTAAVSNISNVSKETVTSETASSKTAVPAVSTIENGVAWYDVQQWKVEGKGWKDVERFYARFPSKAKGVIPDSVWNLSQHSAGMLIRFKTDADTIQVRYDLYSGNLAMPHMAATGVSGFDLYVLFDESKNEWRWVSCTKPSQKTATETLISGIEKKEREYMLYFPLYNGTNALSLGVPESASMSILPPKSDSVAPIVYYGTSIAHGACASRPGMAYTNILGRRLNLPVINLGFSGSARMEPEVGRLLAEQNPCLFVIDALPNMNAQLIRERAIPFIKILREKHPETPILLVEGRFYTNSYLVPAKKSVHDAEHAELKKAFQTLIDNGDKNLYYLSAENQLGEDIDYDSTVDSSHPNDLGMVRMTDSLEKVIRPILEKTPSSNAEN